MPTRILIVDDDIEALRLMGLMLERKGYEIQAASSGVQALDKVTQTPPDVIILDVMMPDIDGFEIARQLREAPHTANIPILFFTAKSSINDKIVGFQSGGDDYLTKPVHPNELISHIEGLLQHRAVPAYGIEHGRAIAFLPVKGGTGNSTLALNTALLLTRIQPNRKTILVELVEGNGSMALQLGRTGRSNLQGLLGRELAQLSPSGVEEMLIRHTSGLHILPGSPKPAGVLPILTEIFVRTLLNILLTDYDYVLLDLPPTLNKPTREALQRARYVVVTAQPNSIGFNLAQINLENLANVPIIKEHIGAILLQHYPGPGVLTEEKSREKLPCPLLAYIPAAPELFSRSWENNKPIALTHPESPPCIQMRNALEMVLAQL